MTGITVGQAGDQLVAVKQARDPDHRARLRHEADLLGRLEHPGVVRLVDYVEGPPAALRTAFVGPDTWRTSSVNAAGFAALTATIADLHDSGLVHGDLRAEHVLLDADQRPILCGFADAGPATGERMQADRAALASMLRNEAANQPHGVGHRMRDAADVLDEPALPTRAAIRLLDDRSPTGTEPRRPHPTRRAVAGAAGALVCLAVALLAAAILLRPSPSPDTSGAPTPAAETETETGTETAATVLDSSAATSAPAAATPADDPEPAAIVVHDGRRYGIGVVGDLVHVADWNCDGLTTPAVLRPGTGELAVFTTWPAPEATLLPSLTVVVKDATDFAVAQQPCPELRVRTPNGSRLIEVPS